MTAVPALCLLAQACSKTESVSEDPVGRFEVTVERPSVQSKAAFADGEGIFWQKDDAQRFSMVSGDGTLHVAEGVSISDDGKATFSFSYVPKSDEAVSFFYGIDGQFSHEFGTAQTQSEHGRINPENLCFTSVDAIVSDGKCMPKMRMNGSTLRFLIYSATGQYVSEKIESVELKTDETVAGKCVFGGDDVAFEGVSGSVVVTLSEPCQVSATDRDGTMGRGIYMSLSPDARLSAGYSYVVTTDRATYTLNSPSGTEFADGLVRNVFVNLEKENVERQAREMELYVPGAEDIGNYIKLGAPGAFDAYGTISVSFWFKGAEKLNVQRQGSIISNFISPGGGCFYGWEVNTWASDDQGNGSYRLRVSRAFGEEGRALREPSNEFTDYTGWHHIAYTFDNSSHYTALYVDGNRIGDDTFDAAPKSPGYEVQMCAFKSLTDPNNPKSVSGSIKKLRFWDKALSAEEVAADMTAEATGSEDGLIAAWDFTWKPEDRDSVLDKTGRHTAQILGNQIEWRSVE